MRDQFCHPLIHAVHESSGFPTRSDTNQTIQPHKMARCLKFRIKIEKGLFYPCSENKGADQLRGHREADLRLCFRICKKQVFSRRGSHDLVFKTKATERGSVNDKVKH